MIDLRYDVTLTAEDKFAIADALKTTIVIYQQKLKTENNPQTAGMIEKSISMAQDALKVVQAAKHRLVETAEEPE